MAWTNVKCSDCGNDYRVQMYGPHTQRDYKVENWAGLCDDCKAEKAKKSAANNKASGLPALKGSPKQIAWAESIRAAMVKYMQTADGAAKICCELLVANLQNAHVWIDCRSSDPGVMAYQICRDIESVGKSQDEALAAAAAAIREM